MSPTSPPAEDRLRLRIYEAADAIWCSRKCAAMAKAAGFGEADVWGIAIAVSELVTNVLKYAGEGTLEVNVRDEGGPSLSVRVEDSGPGIRNIDSALKDGWSQGKMPEEDPQRAVRRGLGAGLGAVNRLMDRVEIENKPAGGVIVTAEKHARKGDG